MALTRIAKWKQIIRLNLNSYRNISGHSLAFVSQAFSHSLGFCSRFSGLMRHDSNVCLPRQWHCVNFFVSRAILREGGLSSGWLGSFTSWPKRWSSAQKWSLTAGCMKRKRWEIRKEREEVSWRDRGRYCAREEGAGNRKKGVEGRNRKTYLQQNKTK